MSNDTIHGKLNNNLNIVKYTGKETDTAKVTVDSTERTISVDVKEQGGSSSISDAIRIKSVKLYLNAGKYILEIISHPISDNIINLIKTTDTVRLMLNGLNRRAYRSRAGRHRRNTAKYYLRQDLNNFTEDEITNFFKFRAPQVTEDMLVVTSNGTYIKFVLDLEELLKSKIRAVSGNDVNIPDFYRREYYNNRLPVSMLAYYNLQSSNYFMPNFSRVGIFRDSISYSPLLNTTALPNLNKKILRVKYHAYNLNNQLLTTPVSINNLKSIFCWDSASIHSKLGSAWYNHNNAHMTASIEDWFTKINSSSDASILGGTSDQYYINLFNTPYVNDEGRFCILGKHGGKNSRHRNNEYAVFSFGILDRESTSHIWKKSFEKYPAVFITNYQETCKYNYNSVPSKISYVQDSVYFTAIYSLKPLPTHKKIWD